MVRKYNNFPLLSLFLLILLHSAVTSCSGPVKIEITGIKPIPQEITIYPIATKSGDYSWIYISTIDTGAGVFAEKDSENLQESFRLTLDRQLFSRAYRIGGFKGPGRLPAAKTTDYKLYTALTRINGAGGSILGDASYCLTDQEDGVLMHGRTLVHVNRGGMDDLNSGIVYWIGMEIWNELSGTGEGYIYHPDLDISYPETWSEGIEKMPASISETICMEMKKSQCVKSWTQTRQIDWSQYANETPDLDCQEIIQPLFDGSPGIKSSSSVFPVKETR